MTNLQQNAPVLSPVVLRRLWFGLPAAVLAGGALLLGVAALVPLWQTMQHESTRLQELQDLQQQVNLMRQQMRAEELNKDKLLAQRERLYALITGVGDLSTMVATLDREAKASGIRLDTYDPEVAPAAAAPATAAKPGQPQAQPPGQPAAPATPAVATGADLPSSDVLISARGSFEQLLAFLRRLEALNILVIQNNLSLEAPKPSSDKSKPKDPAMTMKLGLKLYSKPPENQASASRSTGPASANRTNGT